MEWRRASGAQERLRLGYGLNLHAPRTLEECLAGLEQVTLPLKERLGPSAPFGVGLYLPAELAARLAQDAHERARLAAFLEQHALDAFTFNAFPFGGFQTDGLKQRVFAPGWSERARLDYTLDVARVAAALARPGAGPISISTHTGQFGPLAPGSSAEAATLENLTRCARELAEIEQRQGLEIVLALEPEPRASCGDHVALRAFHARLLEQAGPAQAALRRHVGSCLDACHAAVEFEDARTLRWAGRLGKLQFSSALAVRDPGANPRGRAALLALDEPRFLHQVTGRGPTGLLRATDLDELARALERADPGWLACEEWRCHFHVPVDLDQALGLHTTRAVADELLLRLLAEPGSWDSPLLQVEIETYTWEVLPGFVRSAGSLIDGLEREYRHVMGLLERAGWQRA